MNHLKRILEYPIGLSVLGLSMASFSGWQIYHDCPKDPTWHGFLILVGIVFFLIGIMNHLGSKPTDRNQGG